MSKMNKNKVVRTRLESSLLNSLNMTSKRLRISKSELIRQGIENAIERL